MLCKVTVTLTERRMQLECSESAQQLRIVLCKSDELISWRWWGGGGSVDNQVKHCTALVPQMHPCFCVATGL